MAALAPRAAADHAPPERAPGPAHGDRSRPVDSRASPLVKSGVVTSLPSQIPISQPGDAVERDARQRADAIAGGGPAAGGRRPSSAPASRPISRTGDGTVSSAPIRDAIDSPARGLSDQEQTLARGVDTSTVRIHGDHRAARSASALGAAAYAIGNHIVLGSGYRGGSQSGRRLMAHELAHVAQHRSNHARLEVRRDLAIEPPLPAVEPGLSDGEILDAIEFDSATITDPDEISLLRGILGLPKKPAVIDAHFVHSVALFQSGFGLKPDGKVTPLTRRRLSLEILTEAKALPAEGVGDLGTGLLLRTRLTTLLGAGNKNYPDYKAQIQAASLLQRDVVLADIRFLTQLRSALAWNDFAKCVELMGRNAPTFAELTQHPAVRAAIVAAWAASNVGVNPPAAGQHEEGGWVYLNLITGALTVVRAPAGAQAALHLEAPPIRADNIVVGKIHTHPNLGPGWLAAPSPPPNGDVTVDAIHGVPDLVVGTPGVNPAVFQIFASGPNRRLHLAGSRGHPGAAGGIAPQARADGTEDRHGEYGQ